MVQGVSDSCDSAVSINCVIIKQVTSDEPDNIRGDSDDNTRNDIVIAPNCKSVQLRAERDGLKNDRVYVITLGVKYASGTEGYALVQGGCAVEPESSPGDSGCGSLHGEEQVSIMQKIKEKAGGRLRGVVSLIK